MGTSDVEVGKVYAMVRETPDGVGACTRVRVLQKDGDLVLVDRGTGVREWVTINQLTGS